MTNLINVNWQIPIIEAAASDCRWPADMDNDYSGNWSVTTDYCGRPVLTGKVYCGDHCKRAYGLPQSTGPRNSWRRQSVPAKAYIKADLENEG